ncbi:MAG TPA: hypothetical protein DGT23_16850 [Micromonosporaceae bacterium]|nr:hypothetical protein [Micromonosporaceae bacterium]
MRSARQLLVWFHAITSIGWMTMALALFTLLLQGSGAAYEMAEVLDKQLLQHLATSAAFSGLMLAALTSWGYFRYWWVLTKFAITLTQLYVGIFILSPRLNAVESGDPTPLIVASGLMASAIAFQAWLSVAKPWRVTPWTRSRSKLPAFPAWMFLAVLAVPVFDYVFWNVVFGAPAPILSLLIALTFPLYRRRFLLP